MVVQEDIPMMELFRKSVNASREALAKVEVREELTYHYAIVRVYSKMLVTSCAIYTLLINGYPDDAMALCRQLYESLVIIDTLLKGKQKNDTELLERFMDAPAIMELKNDYEMVLYALKHDPNNQHAKSQLDMINNGSQKYLQKYRKDEIKDFKDYWWSGYDNLTKMAQQSDFQKGYIFFAVGKSPHDCAWGLSLSRQLRTWHTSWRCGWRKTTTTLVYIAFSILLRRHYLRSLSGNVSSKRD